MDTDRIQLIDLDTGYHGRTVTRDINATLCAGELTCLLGPNGAGKSTLLKTICGFLPPKAGSIVIDGADIRSYKAHKLARLIGVVLTERPSALDMTVEELVSLGRAPYTSFWGSLRAPDRRVVDHAIATIGIETLRRRKVNSLSDGERQKAMIAKALAQQTRIILLDEPTAFLDYPGKVEMMKLLSRVAIDEGKIVFMSTHDIELAMRIADRLWLLDRTHGLSMGTPAELASDGTVAAYFNRPGLTFEPKTRTFIID